MMFKTNQGTTSQLNPRKATLDQPKTLKSAQNYSAGRLIQQPIIRKCSMFLGLALLAWSVSGAEPEKLFEVVPPEKAAFNYPAPPREGKKDYFTIAENGQARCVILQSADSKAKQSLRAAETLKAYLDLVTGADIPVIKDGKSFPAGMGVIHVGDTGVGLQTELAMPDVRYGNDVFSNINGYLVKTVSTNVLVIRGKTDRATMLGVIGFLKRYTGVRHYWACYAGGIGDVVPKNPNLRVPEVEWRDWPFFISRSLSGVNTYGPISSDPAKNKIVTMDFFRMNLVIPSSESYYKYLSPAKYGKDHPEYFPLFTNGQRYVPVIPTEGPAKGRDPHGWQPCVSNPDVVRIMADALIEHFRKHPDDIAINLAVNDGMGDCMCEKCRAMDAPNADYVNRIGLCDRYIKFSNQVCDLVGKEFTNKIITILAYGSMRQPPTTVKLHSMLMSTLTMGGGNNTFELWDSWMKTGARHMGGYFYHDDQHYFIMPKLDIHQSAKRIRYLVGSGTARHFVQEMYPFWPLDAMVPYVETELLWDPRLDVDAILGEYYTKFFGPAAESMKEFYQALESGYERCLESDGLPHWYGKDFGSLAGGASWEQYKVLNPSEADRAAACLKQAVSKAKDDPLVSERIDIVRRLFEFAAMGARQYWAMERLGESRVASETEAEKVLADAREAAANARAQSAYKFEVMEKAPANIYAVFKKSGTRPVINYFYDDIKEGVHPQIALAVSKGFDAINKYLAEKIGADQSANWWRRQRETEKDPVIIGAMTIAAAKAKGIILVNLIKDPGFELRGAGKSLTASLPIEGHADLKGLRLFHSHGTPFTWALARDEAHSGQYSVMFTECYKAALSESFKASENESFGVSVWVKHNDKQGTYHLSILPRGKNGNLQITNVPIPLKPGEWQEVKMDYTAPLGTLAITIHMFARGQAQEAKIWIDDLFVGKYP